MQVVYNVFLYFMWFIVTFYMIYIVLGIIVFKKKFFENPKPLPGYEPFVSLIIPAWNEEKTVADTIKSLYKVTYKKVEFIIVNDGSTDRTAKIVDRWLKILKRKGETRFRFIDNKDNNGKAARLNQGIALAKGEFIACMDADTEVEPGIFEKVIPEFQDPKAGAVTVSVEVGNKKKLLNKLIQTEFNLGLSMLLKLFSFSKVVWVTPGPFSMYRADLLRDIGGFDVKSIVEDHEIAFRIYKEGYHITNTMHARVYADMPETFKGSFYQRRRWYSGSIITMFQHKKMLLTKKHDLFSFFIPFNMFIISLSLAMFAFSTGLLLHKLVKNLIFFSQTGFNFFSHWIFEFNPLFFGRVNLLGLTMFVMVVLFILLGLTFSRRRIVDNPLGVLLFPFFYIFYQIYWWGAVIAVITKRGKIAWR